MRYINVNDVFSNELAPAPASMLTKNGMRICKAKSKLKSMLQEKVS